MGYCWRGCLSGGIVYDKWHKTSKGPLSEDSAPPPAQRVREIVEMMISGQWGTGKSFSLAEVWKLDESTVRKHAAEASRFIVACAGDPTEVKGRLLGMLEEALMMARDGASTDPVKAGKLIVDIVKQHAVLAGVNAPTKVAITDSKGNDLPAALREVLADPLAARFYLENDRPPTPEEFEALKAPKTPENG